MQVDETKGDDKRHSLTLSTCIQQFEEVYSGEYEKRKRSMRAKNRMNSDLQITNKIRKRGVIKCLIVHRFLTLRADFSFQTISRVLADAVAHGRAFSLERDEHTIQPMNINLTDARTFRTSDQVFIERPLRFQVRIVAEIVAIEGLLS